MDIDEDSAKLVTYSVIMNLLAGFLGFAAFLIFDVFIGLISFALLVLLLPIGFEYLYLKRKTNND